VIMPIVPGGIPRNARNQSSTTSSTCDGPAASSQTPAKKLVPAHKRSPNTEINVGAPGTKARKRGWLTRQANGATLSAKSARTAAKSRPASGAARGAAVPSRPATPTGRSAGPAAWRDGSTASRDLAAEGAQLVGVGMRHRLRTGPRRASRAASIVVDLLVVLGDAIRLDVPAAVVATGGLVVAAAAVEGAAEEELFQAGAAVVVQLAGVERQAQRWPQPSQLRELNWASSGTKWSWTAARHDALTLGTAGSRPRAGRRWLGG